MDKWAYIKIIKFCASKDTIKGVNRQPTEREKIHANHVYKVFVLRIYKAKQGRSWLVLWMEDHLGRPSAISINNNK